MAPLQLLDQSQEDSLHASRLLNVEEKPFRRLSKRLFSTESPIFHSQQSQAASVPSESTEVEQELRPLKRKRWHEDSLLDATAFESNVIRVQLLATCNHRERRRYAEEKIRILDTAQAVGDNNTDLHKQLEATQSLMATRKTYDELAEKITSKPALRPRDDQHVQSEKLNAEIVDLERQSSDYSNTWTARGAQFEKLVEEGRQLLRLIKDEKEEADRKEGMEQVEDGEDGEMAAAKGIASGAQTPKPAEGSSTPSNHNQGESQETTSKKVDLRLGEAAESTEISQADTATTEETQKNEIQIEIEGNEEITDSDEAEEGEEIEDEPVEEIERMDVT